MSLVVKKSLIGLELHVSIHRYDTVPNSLNVPVGKKIHLEELLHYAAIQRKRDEAQAPGPPSGPNFKSSRLGELLGLKGEKNDIIDTAVVEVSDHDDEKRRTPSPGATLDERTQARRAMRTATWLNIFYLITTE